MEGAKTTILLVEDDNVVGTATASGLRAEGFRIVLASTGEEAVARARDASPPIDLVLMDVDLGPGMDGPSAAEIILSERDIPLVFLSSHTESEIVERTERISSYGYVVKNSGRVVLLTSIKMAFRLHEANRALRESEDRLKRIFESTGEGIAIVDPEEYFLFANEAADRAFDLGPGELVGRNLAEFTTPEAFQAVRLRTAERSRGEKGVYEFRARGAGGAEKTFLITATPRFDADGRFSGAFAVFRDITDRVRMEAALESSARHQATLMAELQHRVKNNLSIVASLLELELPLVDEGRSRDVLEAALSRIRTMTAIYDRLRLSSGPGTVELKEYFEDLRDSVAEMYRAEGRGIGIRIEADSVHLDSKRAVSLGIIANEAFVNAMKHAFPGGRSGEVILRLRGGGQSVSLDVSDNGIGLAPGAREGEGLGMRLIGVLVQQVGGELRVTGEGGVTVSVTFPA
jgi:PAS domain S-box-containing protein